MEEIFGLFDVTGIFNTMFDSLIVNRIYLYWSGCGHVQLDRSLLLFLALLISNPTTMMITTSMFNGGDLLGSFMGLFQVFLAESKAFQGKVNTFIIL